MHVPRIAPISPPYSESHRKLFDLVMPEGMEPLSLFRVLANSDRILSRFMRAGVLDRGPVDIRHRELVIHRTTARCGSEYEWGVHVNAFARPLGLSDEWIRATVSADADDPIWSPSEAVLVRLCDELHDTATISEALWKDLSQHFSEDVILELIYTAGMYHAVSFLTNGLALENEAFAERFPQ
ncbi:MAG: carboxymuconolactone decarboxylase family protein [Deltaproteobacteria bacterium]|nr:carboxymuconolactone decarboxylase family protein [Deltaproteobacteria bacterium]MBW2724236.1 carboxymuconolactone decarboxylase family protein [Deltaproteobacteria bacterium]